MNDERWEERAALHALHLLDEAAENELREAARRDPEIARLVREFTETAALLVYEATEIKPPPHVKDGLLRLSPSRKVSPKIIPFPTWIPYAAAAGLMALCVLQAIQVAKLKSGLKDLRTSLAAEDTMNEGLRQTNALKDLRLAALSATAPAQANGSYAAARILVAWDPTQKRGVVSLRDLPIPPAGHDYQLWVLDPQTATPISAGLISGSRPFVVDTVKAASPGFAISLEPSGGRQTPTGPVLFAVAAGQ